MKLDRENLENNVVPEPNTGCWLWLGGSSSTGYGNFHINGKQTRAHKAYYEHFKDAVPEGLCVLHKCDTPSCVNPEHLFIGTNRDNILDMIKKNRHKRKTGSGPGEKAANHRLTNEQVLAIRKDPRSLSIVGKEYGMDPSTIGKIKNRKLWKHL